MDGGVFYSEKFNEEAVRLASYNVYQQYLNSGRGAPKEQSWSWTITVQVALCLDYMAQPMFNHARFHSLPLIDLTPSYTYLSPT